MVEIYRAENKRTERYKLCINLCNHAHKIWLTDKMLKRCNAVAYVIIEYVCPSGLFVEPISKDSNLLGIFSDCMADNRHSKRITIW